jgi:hypothetical protein
MTGVLSVAVTVYTVWGVATAGVPEISPVTESKANPVGRSGLIVRVSGGASTERSAVANAARGLPTVAVTGGFAARAGPATATDSPTAAMLTDVTIATILAGIRTKWLLVVVTTVSYVWG